VKENSRRFFESKWALTHSRIFPSNLWVDTCQEASRYSCKPPPFLNVLVARPSISALGGDENLGISPAVKVTTFDDGKTASSCELVRRAARQVNAKQFDLNVTWNVLSLGCTYNATLAQPQILVTVNFTQLDGISNSSLNFPFVHVMVGNTNDTDEVVRVTESPAVILPGENIVGFAKQHVLQRLKSQISSTLGMSNLYDTIVISELVQLRPDPLVSKSPLIISSPNFATIRIIPFINIGDWKVIEEYRDKSALKGLSGVGGLWSFFGNCFALFFWNFDHEISLSLQTCLSLWDNSFLPTKLPGARQMAQGIPNCYRKTQECRGLR